MKTITTTNMFGREVELTKEEFVARWKEHAEELHRLGFEYRTEIVDIVDRVVALAETEFD